jgi:hypothetical protein
MIKVIRFSEEENKRLLKMDFENIEGKSELVKASFFSRVRQRTKGDAEPTAQMISIVKFQIEAEGNNLYGLTILDTECNDKQEPKFQFFEEAMKTIEEIMWD